ncbi:MAG TPA: bifunctional 3-deoxy-7-phosphoheptulonate synthase/chorismate mutase type II [Flavobacterium sp.]|nr:bifunctional 3-deoxy-7-phosphoheptulonate synthase/chorismate mutase type II [Flavobacterium sp.]
MENDTSTHAWLTNMQLGHPLVIAGPCSAETEEQVMQTAIGLVNTDATIYRAGIWKPRTRPGGFEGVGAIGLKWLQRAKAETGLKMAVEVANAAHVKLALDHDIDVLWIGARTTVNPFAVQEIADALKDTDRIVLIKNPVNPDLSLWIGGIERLYNSGIRNLGAIHRGFSTYEKTKYRNIPEWQIAIELQARFPHLPLICDPSHISGKRELIHELSQQALDLNYEGLMIETHIDPENAWSDARQQVTPAALDQILKALVVRNQTDEDAGYVNKLAKYRVQIDSFDTKLVEVLGDRMKVSEKIGKLKKESNVAILQKQRWLEIRDKMVSEGALKDLDEEFILKVFKAIHEESILRQGKVINS